MSLIDTLMERYPKLDLAHRDTLHRLADRLGHVPAETSVPSKSLGTMTKKTWDETGKYQHTKRVGPYLLGDILGEGSFAKVKEAMHSVIGEKVAIKIVDKRKIRDDVYLRKNMRREAAILQILQHPNIVRLYEVMETENNLYMVLELCKGGPLLEKIVNEGKLSEDTTKGYVLQILSAIDHMHQAGVLHRDLKVENILLDDEGNLKLIDFGLSNFLSSISRNGRHRHNMQATQCGSPAYAAPEIIANKRYGAKVDVWSVGVNTFAMLTGTLPFIVEPFNIKVLLRKMVTKDMTQMPKNISKDCQDFIKHLLQPNPRARPSLREVMSHSWLAESKQTSSQPRTVTPPPRGHPTATPPPSGRTRRMNVDAYIVEYIWKEYGIQSSYVSNSVICKRADEYSAIYYLLMKRRERKAVRMAKSGVQGVEQNEKSKNKMQESVDRDMEKNEETVSEKQSMVEMSAEKHTNRKHGSVHFKETSLAFNEDLIGECQIVATKKIDASENRGKGKDSFPSKNTNRDLSLKLRETDANDADLSNTSETKRSHKEVKNNSEQHAAQDICKILRKYGNRQPTPIIPCSTSGGKDAKFNNPTAVSSKMQQFREAFETAKTSGFVEIQLEHRVSEINNGPFSTQPRRACHVPSKSLNLKDAGKTANHAHKVNLTFRQSDPGSKESFMEHFNYRRRKPGPSARAKSVDSKGRKSVRINLTPVYSRIKTERQYKFRKQTDHDLNVSTAIQIYHQETPQDPQQAKLTQLIEDVKLANTPALDLDDAMALTQAQQEAMATFRSSRAPKKPVPSEFHKLECTRRVKVAKRKSIDVPIQTRRRMKSSPFHLAKNTGICSSTSNRQIRRKLSMEQTLELYRSRNPARSPCMCQPQNSGSEKSRNSLPVGKSEKDAMLEKKASTLPEIAPPLISVSPRSKPSIGKPTQELSHYLHTV